MAVYTFTSKRSYQQRFRRSLLTILAISVVAGWLVSIRGDIKMGFGVAFFFFVVQYLKAVRQEKTFINLISIESNLIQIEYQNEGISETLNGSIAEFSFKKKFTFSKTRTPYLVIYQNKELKIRQYLEGDWTEERMDELLTHFSKMRS